MWSLLVAPLVLACGSTPSGGGFGSNAGGTAAAGGTPTAGGAPAMGGTSTDSSGGVVTATGGAVPAAGGSTFIPGSPGRASCSTDQINVLFLIDRSGSMNCNLPPITASDACEAMSPPAKVDPASPSKWEVISDVLGQALNALAPADAKLDVRAGLSYFSIDGVCGATSTPTVPMAAVNPAQLDLIRSSIVGQKPKGGTPIVGGSVLAYKYLHQTLGVTGNAHVVLITDGADSCADYYASNPAIGPGDHVASLIATEAPKAAAYGIKTWVIGAPGSEPARSTLSNLAIAGDTQRSTDCTPGSSANPTTGDCHYDMTTGDFRVALQTALDHIMAVVTCQTTR
jgi:hypothetical protein